MNEVHNTLPKDTIFYNIEVKFTTNMEQFSFMNGNRTPNPKHIQQIVKSIKNYGVLCNPIIVNEHNHIVDGQHRYMAAKEEGKGIYYIVVPGYRLEHVHTLNINQRNWSKKEFLEGYAKKGIESYIQLQKFYTENSEFSLTDCVRICSVGSKNSKNSFFKEGLWEMGDLSLAEKHVAMIKQFKDYYSGYCKQGFVSTMLYMFQHDKFSFQEFLGKVKLQPLALHDCGNIEQWKTLIEDIYNYKRMKKVNLRMYY